MIEHVLILIIFAGAVGWLAYQKWQNRKPPPAKREVSPNLGLEATDVEGFEKVRLENETLSKLGSANARRNNPMERAIARFRPSSDR